MDDNLLQLAIDQSQQTFMEMEIVPFLAEHYSTSIPDLDDTAGFRKTLNWALSNLWHGKSLKNAVKESKQKLKTARDQNRFESLMNTTNAQSHAALQRGSEDELESIFTNFEPVPEHAETMLNLLLSAGRQLDVSEVNDLDPAPVDYVDHTLPKLVRETLKQQEIIDRTPLSRLTNPENMLYKIERSVADKTVEKLVKTHHYDELQNVNDSMVLRTLDKVKREMSITEELANQLWEEVDSVDEAQLSNVSKNVITSFKTYKQTLEDIAKPLVDDLLRVNNIPVKVAKKLLTTSKKDVQKAIDYSFDAYNVTDGNQSSSVSDKVYNFNFTEDETEELILKFDQLFELEEENSLLISAEQKTAFVSGYNSMIELEAEDPPKLNFQDVQKSSQVMDLVKRVGSVKNTVADDSIFKWSDNAPSAKVEKFNKIKKINLVLGVIDPNEIVKFEKTALPFMIKQKSIPQLSQVQANPSESNYVGYTLGPNPKVGLNSIVKSQLIRDKFSTIETTERIIRIENALPDLSEAIEKVNEQIFNQLSEEKPLQPKTSGIVSVDAARQVIVDEIMKNNTDKLIDATRAIDQNSAENTEAILLAEMRNIQQIATDRNLNVSALAAEVAEQDLIGLLDMLSTSTNPVLEEIIVQTINQKTTENVEKDKQTDLDGMPSSEITKNEPTTEVNERPDDKMSADYNAPRPPVNCSEGDHL